ncbi:hypothetical protein BVRB_2g042390 [Beta vulgaris subsp. vulgaris]|nr:hypothetical protein BVRB_2g042390 [Beta vulgaris subsp. vulgaris]
MIYGDVFSVVFLATDSDRSPEICPSFLPSLVLPVYLIFDFKSME